MYVYDMPARFNTDLVDLPTIWHPEQYDIDQVSPALEWGGGPTTPPCMQGKVARHAWHACGPNQVALCPPSCSVAVACD